tara:strand:- start:336 stop:983 length:648 start_codon:yes stop_codon:yes gene_type:complete
VLSCSKNDKTNNFSIKIEIEGLRKGIVSLEKFDDSSLMKIDSGFFNGNKSVRFQGKINEPEIMLISLTFENEPDPKRFPVFVEKSNMILKTRLKDFGFKVDSKGSKNDSIYRQYLVINKKFNNEKLDLISKSLGFQKSNDKDSISFYDSKIMSVNKRQFLHNANFALRYSNYAIAPYIAISDLRESSAILDTIYKSLDDGIKKSKYALELKTLIN